MNKLVKGLLCVVALMALIVVVFYGCGLEEYVSEIPSRLALYHNTGKINVTIDGEPIDLNDVEITYAGDGNFIKSTKVSDGKFKFRKGLYGVNTFSFELPNDKVNGVAVEFGHFNCNWWHVVNYDVNVDIVSNDDTTFTAKISQVISYAGKKHPEAKQEGIVLNSENALIKINTGP